MEKDDDISMQPSTSKRALKRLREGETVEQNIDDDLEEILPFIQKDDEEEIERLEAAAKSKDSTQNEPDDDDDDERIAKIKFACSTCDMEEMVHYYGKKPPFVYGIEFLEDTYIMRDPFQPPPPRGKPKGEYFIAIGSKCAECGCYVCKGTECSFYYTRTFCLKCAEKTLPLFPEEVQTKFKKVLAEKPK